jgi:SAM-dependent methyltransferase
LLTRSGHVTHGVADAENLGLHVYPHDWLLRWLGIDLTGKRVLDAGCWNAPLGTYLQRRGIEAKYYGLDVSLAALRSARRAHSSLDLARSDLTQPLPFESSSFDLIAFINTYEHLASEEVIPALRRLGTLLRPNGVLVLATDVNSALNVLDPAWIFGHRHHWPSTIERAVREAGLRTVCVHFNGGLWQALDLIGLYVAKHVRRRGYATPGWLRARAEREYEGVPRSLAARVWFKCVRSRPPGWDTSAQA